MKPLTSLILAVLVALFAFVAYGAAYSAVSAKSDEVAGLQDQINMRTATVNRLTTARATLAQLSTDETSVQNYFVPQSGIVSFIDGLEATGRTLGTNVQVQSVSTNGTPVRPTLDLSLAIDGTFDAVMRTVGAIEYAPYAITLTRLSVGALDKGSWEAQMELLVGSRADASSTPATTP